MHVISSSVTLGATVLFQTILNIGFVHKFMDLAVGGMKLSSHVASSLQSEWENGELYPSSRIPDMTSSSSEAWAISD